MQLEIQIYCFPRRLVRIPAYETQNMEGLAVFIWGGRELTCKWTQVKPVLFISQLHHWASYIFTCLWHFHPGGVGEVGINPSGSQWPGPELGPPPPTPPPACGLTPSWVMWCCWLWALKGPWWTVGKLFCATLLLTITLPSPRGRWMEKSHTSSFCGRSLCLPFLC